MPPMDPAAWPKVESEVASEKRYMYYSQSAYQHQTVRDGDGEVDFVPKGTKELNAQSEGAVEDWRQSHYLIQELLDLTFGQSHGRIQCSTGAKRAVEMLH